MVFKRAKDRNGEFAIEFIPFHAGDARVMSVPAEEVMYCATGKGDKLAYGLIALRLGHQSVHHAMSVAMMRQLAANLVKTADMIEAGVPA